MVRTLTIQAINSHTCAERVPEATKLLSDAFETNPSITYFLASFSAEKRNAYRPKLFSALLKSAALNGGIFNEANGWKSCGVLMPPGTKIAGLSTLLPSGMTSMFVSLGFAGCQVSGRIEKRVRRLTTS